MSDARRPFRVLAVAAMLAATAFVGAPAQAATPYCTTAWRNTTSDGDIYVLVPATSNTSTRNLHCLMGRGAVHAGVGALQRSLKYCYGKAITIDNIFGPATESALVAVQKKFGITPDGVYGPQTADTIDFPLFATGGGFLNFCA